MCKFLKHADSIAKSVSVTMTAKAKIKELQLGDGISRFKKRKILREINTYAAASNKYNQMIAENPSVLMEMTVGRVKFSNRYLVMEKAKKYLNDDQPYNDIGDEWITKFLDVAGETSDEEKQEILSKMLAGQIKKPGSISYRTLNILRNLTKNEIILFKKALSVAFNSGKNFVILNAHGNDISILRYEDILLLDEFGLLKCESVSSIRSSPTASSINFFTLDDKYILVIHKESNPNTTVPAYVLTKAAEELSCFIGEIKSNLDGIRQFKQTVTSIDSNAGLFEITSKVGSQCSYRNVNIL